MPKKHKPTPHDQVEDAIRTTGSIGGLERLAGIGPTIDERYAFWKDYSHLPANLSLDIGVAELKRRIRAKAARETQP